MSKPRVFKPREVISILETLGFAEVRQKGFTQTVSAPGWQGHNGSGAQRKGYFADPASSNRQGHRFNRRGAIEARVKGA
jgi:hypothetical protein